MNIIRCNSAKYLLMQMFATSLVMCLSAMLLIASDSKGQGIDQVKIDLQVEDATLQSVVQQIQEKTNLKFVSAVDLSMIKGISVDVFDTSVKLILDDLMHQTKLTYVEAGNRIVVKRSNTQSVQKEIGTIQGTILDEKGQPLIGVTVMVEGTSKGAISDINGEFTIEIAPGTYSIILSYVGYETTRIPNIQVKNKKFTAFDYKMREDIAQLGEVVVEANPIFGVPPVTFTTDVHLVNAVKESKLIVTGISNDQIIKSVDFDAAEVVRRAPSVTLFNNFVNIRGLNERYNPVFINKMQAPSTEADNRAFSFDLLPSNIIDNILIYRSPAPELPGDFGGGVVRINTKSTVRARQIQVSVSGHIRPRLHFQDYQRYRGGRTDWLGFDNGTRALPDDFPSRGELGGTTGAFPPGSEEAVRAAYHLRTLNNDYEVLNETNGPDFRIGVNYLDSWNIGSAKLSNYSGLVYWQTHTLRFTERQFGPPGFTASFNQSLDTTSTDMVRSGLIQNLGLKINDRHSIRFNNFFNYLSTDELFNREGVSTGDTPSLLEKSYQYRFTERLLYTTEFGGDHRFLSEKRPLDVGWGIGYNIANENNPDLRRIQLNLIAELNDDDNTPELDDFIVEEPRQYRFGFANQNTGDVRDFNTRFFQETRENNWTGYLDLTYPIYKNWELKTGGFFEVKDRDFVNREISFITSRGADIPNGFIIDGPQDLQRLFDTYNEVDGSGLQVVENVVAASTYLANQDTYAGYGAINIPFLRDQFNFYGGVRYETNSIGFESLVAADSGALDVAIDEDFLLASANLSYDVNEKLKLRVAFGQSINRPIFREISAFNFLDFERNADVRGNPDLVIAELNNYDLRLEFYPSEGQMINFGLFYKTIKNPIEPFETTQSSSVRQQLTFVNSDDAEIYGIELEARKKLDFIPLLKNFSIIINAALLESIVRIDTVIEAANGDFRQQERPLVGASPFTFNASLYYDNERSKTSVSLQYNTSGQRLVLPANRLFPGVYELPRHIIDLSIRQRIKRFELKAGVNDILNQPIRLYRDWNLDERYTPGAISEHQFLFNASDYYEQYFRQGSYVTLGFTYFL